MTFELVWNKLNVVKVDKTRCVRCAIFAAWVVQIASVRWCRLVNSFANQMGESWLRNLVKGICSLHTQFHLPWTVVRSMLSIKQSCNCFTKKHTQGISVWKIVRLDLVLKKGEVELWGLCYIDLIYWFFTFLWRGPGVQNLLAESHCGIKKASLRSAELEIFLGTWRSKYWPLQKTCHLTVF